LLLSLPRIGPTVVARIEAQGIASLRDLQRQVVVQTTTQRHGVEHVVEEVCRRMRTRAWVNRRSALAGALDALVRAAPEAAAADKKSTAPASKFARLP
jgi:hypothetical protein